MKAYIQTLGCKVNRYESQQMQEDLETHGIGEASCGEQADIYIVNSCSVTAEADRKTRQMIRRARRENPDAVICLTGCMPQATPSSADVLGDADIVLGNSNRRHLFEYIEQFIRTGQRIVCIQPHSLEYEQDEPVKGLGERTRAYMKIEDGCNRFCSYCIIPYSRGRVRSRSPQSIAREADVLAQQYRELVLVGINLSAYGSDIGLSLNDAIKAVSARQGISRVRLGSLEPDLMSRELLESLAENDKFCPQFHLSLQSGCDATLRRMNRHYTAEQYRNLVEEIRGIWENPSITTDIMVGFPGETDEEFEQSLSFAREIGFAKAHCFVYSRRGGTAAARMANQIPRDVSSARASAMQEETARTAELFMRSQIGRSASVLLEREASPGIYEGRSENYTPVKVKTDKQRGDIVKAVVKSVEDGFCIAE